MAGGEVICEPGISEGSRARLAAMGHRVRAGHEVFGGYQGLWRAELPRLYYGGSDPRKDGCAAGF
jgi:gamma-glutamyltranspeptidase/glutathione hydrolase